MPSSSATGREKMIVGLTGILCIATLSVMAVRAGSPDSIIIPAATGGIGAIAGWFIRGNGGGS